MRSSFQWNATAPSSLRRFAPLVAASLARFLLEEPEERRPVKREGQVQPWIDPCLE
jgi:hypothetical protein